jgi:transposase
MNAKRTFTILSDADWLIVKAALDVIRSKVGRPFANERRTIEAVIWRFKNDARWREIPAELGPWWRAAQLHYRWQKTGIWTRLGSMLREAGEATLADLFRDTVEADLGPVELDEGALAEISAGARVAGALGFGRSRSLSGGLSARLGLVLLYLR